MPTRRPHRTGGRILGGPPSAGRTPSSTWRRAPGVGGTAVGVPRRAPGRRPYGLARRVPARPMRRAGRRQSPPSVGSRPRTGGATRATASEVALHRDRVPARWGRWVGRSPCGRVAQFDDVGRIPSPRIGPVARHPIGPGRPHPPARTPRRRRLPGRDRGPLRAATVRPRDPARRRGRVGASPPAALPARLSDDGHPRASGAGHGWPKRHVRAGCAEPARTARPDTRSTLG